MRGKTAQVLHAWTDKVELRNAYTFGEEEVSLEEFAGLFQDTFEVIRKAKNEFIYKSQTPEDVVDTQEYLRLLTVLSKYEVYDCVEDESEDRAFTATCLVAQKLVDYATFMGGCTLNQDGSYTYYDDEEEHQGIFTFYGDDYYCDPDEEIPEECTYNIFDGNFDEILELAQCL